LTSPFLPPPEKVEKDFSYAAGQKIGTLEGGGGFGTPKTGQTIVYEAGDDGTYQKGYPLTGDKYLDNGDGTITDLATGLMWPKDATGAGCYNGATRTWVQAIAFCEELDFAEHDDWRLPNVKELQTIIDYSRKSPCIDPIFLNTVASAYWSGTTYLGNTDFAWYWWFANGNLSNGLKAGGARVMPVRDAA